MTSPYSLPPFLPPSQPVYPPPLPTRRSSRGWIIAFFIVLFLLPITASGAYVAGYNNVNAPAPTQSAGPGTIAQPQDTPTETVPTQPPQTGTWTTIKTFTGKAKQQTEVFTVPSEWRIVWSEKLSGPGLFSIDLFSSDSQHVDNVALIANQSSSSTYNAHNESGSFYLSIDSDGASYTIEVQVLE